MGEGLLFLLSAVPPPAATGTDRAVQAPARRNRRGCRRLPRAAQDAPAASTWCRARTCASHGGAYGEMGGVCPRVSVRRTALIWR